jgi:hypothetical protein
MDLENFENDIFWQIFNTNLKKIVFLKKIIKRIFWEYSKIIPQK